MERGASSFRDGAPALALMDTDYEYVKTFTPCAALLQCGKLVLRCEGLDTVASLELNGECIGQSDNMHRIWEFVVTGKLRAGENTLRVVFSSPTRFIAEAHKKTPVFGSLDAMAGFPLLRKAHCMFGWDWDPHLPDAGIWRDISIIGIEHGRFESVYIEVH